MCLFEFHNDDQAQVMLRASLPGATFTKADAFFWVVESIDSNHIGHSQPYRECEKNLYLTYAMKTTAKAMSESGCTASDIADYLSSRGCTGTLTEHRLKYHVNDVSKDMEEFTVMPKSNETDAEALIRVLQEKKCRYIYLYTNAANDNSPSCMEMVNSDSQHVAVTRGDVLQSVRGWFSHVASKISAFFDDAWALPSQLDSVNSVAVLGRRKIADREKKDKWEPAKRLITVNGQRKMLMAILWATQEELLLAKKYPEVWGHDTKACTDQTGVPWWYTVGFREDFKTFIGMRGHIANETQPMFNFTLQVALPFILGGEVLDACVAQVGDAKNEFVNTVQSMIAKGGVTPHAYLLLCAWHLTDRALHAKFKGTRGAWSDSLYQCFWRWQRCETIEHHNLVYNWFKNDWFSSRAVRVNMPPGARDGALELIENLHMRRQHWSLACTLDVAAHDTRTNTFVEVQNHVLMDVVHVRSNMTMQTMVTKESLVHSRKDRKFAHQNFRTLTTASSKTAEDASGILAKVCAFMHDVTTPEIGKLVTKQVSIAIECLENVETSWKLCSCLSCKVCLQYMTRTQKQALAASQPILVFHMNMELDKNDESMLRHSSLGPEWDELHATIPVVKYPRVITAQDVGDGKFLFICSCGFGARYQCVCRHIAMILLHASMNSCAGCERDNIALRNTAAFAACNDLSLIQRSANDWRGIICNHVTEDSLKNCPCGDVDRNDGDNDVCNDEGAQAAPRRTSSRQAEEDARWKQHRDVEMTKIQDHFYRVKSKLLSCKKEEFFQRAAIVDTHLLEAFRELIDVEEVADTVVAHRYRDDPKRRTPPPKRARTTRPRTAAQAPTAPQDYVLVHTSDTEEPSDMTDSSDV
jgi:hypothetical protein